MMELFDSNSIAVNKQGKKSEKQIQEIKEAVKPSIWLWVGLAMLVFGGCFFAFLISMESGAASAFGAIIAAVGLFAALRGASNWNLRRKLLAEAVQSAEGTVTFKEQGVAGQLIDVDRYIAATSDGRKLAPLGLAGISPKLPPGNYRFYFLKTRNWLLGAEPLSSEAELLANLNGLLEKSIAFDLASVRQQAQAGQLKTFEGKPKLETKDESVFRTGEDPLIVPHFFCVMGDLRFEISMSAHSAIIPDLNHRLYYREGDPKMLAGLEAL